MPDYHLAIAAIGTAELLILGILFAAVVIFMIVILFAAVIMFVILKLRIARRFVSIFREDFEQQLKCTRRLINAFMVMLLVFPFAGIVALLLGFADPGDGEGSMTTSQGALLLSGVVLLILLFWRMLLVAAKWISTRQAALLFDSK